MNICIVLYSISLQHSTDCTQYTNIKAVHKSNTQKPRYLQIHSRGYLQIYIRGYLQIPSRGYLQMHGRIFTDTGFCRNLLSRSALVLFLSKFKLLEKENNYKKYNTSNMFKQIYRIGSYQVEYLV